MTQEIKLGEKSWPVQSFTLGEMKKIMPMVNGVQGEIRANGMTEKFFDLVFDLLTLVIARADNQFDRPALENIVAPQGDLMDAFFVICAAAGLEIKKPGEAPAAAGS